MHSDEILTRAASASPGSWNPEARTFEAVFSTGAAVKRRDHKGDFLERLSLDQDWSPFIRSPVTDGHRRERTSDVLGSVIAARTVNGEGFVTIKMSKRQKAQAVVDDILDGHLSGRFPLATRSRSGLTAWTAKPESGQQRNGRHWSLRLRRSEQTGARQLGVSKWKPKL